MSILLGALFLIICFLIISLVLLQEGKGGGLAAMGAGSMDSVMGVKNPLRRWTTYLFIAFILFAVGINKYYSMQAGGEIPEGIEVEDVSSTETEPGTGENLMDGPTEADIAREVSGALGRQQPTATAPEMPGVEADGEGVPDAGETVEAAPPALEPTTPAPAETEPVETPPEAPLAPAE